MYVQLLEAEPDDLDLTLRSLRALERLHTQLGDQPGLAQDLRRLIELEDDPERRSDMLWRLGELLHKELGDTDGAIEIFRRRLEMEPQDQGTLRVLEGLYQTTKQWEPLIDILQMREVGLDDDPPAQLAIHRRLAEIYEENLDDTESAIAAYQDVISRFGHDRESLHGLARLYRAGERWHELQDTFEMQAEEAADADERVGLLFESAELMRLHTHDPERAFETYCEILAQQPGHKGAAEVLRQLVDQNDSPMQVPAARRLAELHAGRSEHAEQVYMLSVIANSDDPVERLGALRTAAEVSASELDDVAAAFEFQGRAVRLGLDEPDAETMLEDYERYADKADRWQPYAAALETIAPDILDAELRGKTMMKAASVAADRLHDANLAKKHYERLLEDQPDHAAALDALLALSIENDDHLEVALLLGRKAELSDDRRERGELFVRQAALFEGKLSDDDRAIDAFDQAIAEHDHELAYEGLERLYAKSERWDNLAELYEREIERRVGDPADIHHKLAKLCAEQLQDMWRAVDHYREALSLSEEHLPTIQALEELEQHPEHRAAAAEILEPVFLRRMDWPKVISTIDARLSDETDPAKRIELFKRLAEVQETHLEDLDGALDTYAKVVLEDPTDPANRERFSHLAHSLERWEQLAQTYDTALSQIEFDDSDSARLAIATAELYDERLGQIDKAALYYERALTFDPSDASLARRLASAYKRTNAWQDLLALFQERERFADTDAERVSILHDIDRTEADHLEAYGDAIETYHRILELAPRDEVALVQIDELLAREERWDDLAEHLHLRMERVRGTGVELDLQCRLGVLTHAHLADTDRGIDLLEDVLERDHEHEDALEALTEIANEDAHAIRVADILEPIYRRAGNWEREVDILELRLRQADDDSDKVAFLSSIARLQEESGGDPKAAFGAWKRALLIVPTADEPRAALDRLSAELENWDEYVDTYERATNAPQAAELRESLLLRVAQVNDEKRGDPRAAIRDYQRVLEADPTSESALSGLQMLYTMVGDWQGLTDLLEHRIGHTDKTSARVHALNHLGALWEEELGDSKRAVEVFERTLSEDAADPDALFALDRLLSNTDQVDRLAEVLAARLGLEDDPHVGVELGLRLADLHETRRGDPDRAIEVLEQVAHIGPGGADALDHLARVRERQGQWTELIDVLRRRLDIEDHEVQRLALTYRIAEVFEHELDDVASAIDAHASAIAIDPEYEPSLQALLRIAKLADYREQAAEIVEPQLRAQQRWDELAALIEDRAGGSEDAQDRGDRLMMLADVHEHERNDPSAAFDALLRVLQEQPGRPDALGRAHGLSSSLNRWSDLAESLTLQASAALEPNVAARLHALHAQIADEELGNPAAAIQCYQQAIAQVGDDPAFLDALDRLYARTEQWKPLTEIIERQLQLEGTERTALLLRLGDLRANQLNDAEGALSTFQDVLEQDRSNPEALEALRKLCDDATVADTAMDILETHYRGSGGTEDLVRLYDLRVERAQTDGDRVGLLREAALIWETELGLPKEALDRLRRAIIVHPHESSLVDDVERLSGVAGEWQALAGLSDEVAKNPDVERRDLYNLRLRAAGWYREHLSDREAAERELEQAIELDPEPVEARRLLVDLFEHDERWADAVGALRALAAIEPQADARLGHLRRAAEIAQQQLSDNDLAADCYDALLAVDSEDLPALESLCELRREQGRWNDVVDLLERRIALDERTETRTALMRELGQALSGPLGQVPRAIEVYERVLEEAPEDGVTFRALEQLYERSGLFNDLRTLLERGLEDAATEADRRAYGMRLAELSESSLEDRSGAIGYLERVLEAEPGDAAATEALGRLLQTEGRWDELAVLLESQDANAADASERTKILYRLAELHETQRKDPLAAIQIYERILEVEGEKEKTLRKLAALLEQREQWSDAIDVLDRLTRVTDAPEAVEIAHRMADLASARLGDADRERAALQAAYSLAPESSETRERLKSHHREHGNYRELAEILSAELDLAQDAPAQLVLLRELSAIHLDQLGDVETSTAYLERAVRLGEDDREMLVPLCDLYLESGRYKEAIPMLEKVIASYGKQRSKELAAHHHRLGQSLEALGRPDDALAAYDRAFTIDLSNIAVLRDLGKLTYARGDLARAQKSFRALLLQRLDDNAGIAKADIYFYLGDIAAKQGDSRKAISMLERALAEDKAHEAATTLLADLKG